jgi:hypothetical protein
MELVMHRVLRYIAAAGILVSACQAQALLDQVNPLGAGREGARLYEVSVFSGYSSSAFPLGAGQIPSPGTGVLGSDATYGVSAVLGLQHHRERTNFSIRYSGAYTGMVHYSDADGYSQWLTLSADRKLSPKWSFNMSASGQDARLIQVLNEPSATSVISQLPSDFNDFAAALGLGSYSTAQAASMILGAPVVQTPLRALLLGNKMLTYSGNGGLTYAYSRHLSFHASSFASGGQTRSAALDGVPQTNYVMPRSLGADAGMSWSYSPSPRTNLGFNVDANRLQNHFQNAYTSTATASVGRKMGMHWFSKIYGGATLTQVTQQLSGTPETRQAVGGASIGIKTYTDSFVASYDRLASDAYGSVVGTYTTLSGTWNRRRPGSRFSTFASFGEQQMSNTGFESFSGWQASGGLSERLTDTTALSAQYVYFKTAGNYLGTPSSLSVQSVRLSMSWSPQSGLR